MFQGEATTDVCVRCGYDLRGATTDVCPECGEHAIPLPHCPDCRIRIVPWTHEDCPGCGRPLDCEADNDQPPPFGILDAHCTECARDLSNHRRLQCDACGVVRLLRLDFALPDRTKAESVLQSHGLLTARARALGDDGRRYLNLMYIRSCCWPSAAWVMESAGIVPLDPNVPVRGRCLHCGYELYGTTSPRCPECGRSASTSPSHGGIDRG